MGILQLVMVYHIFIYIYYCKSMVKYSILRFSITYYGFTTVYYIFMWIYNGKCIIKRSIL